MGTTWNEPRTFWLEPV